jgi:hypothetical protein
MSPTENHELRRLNDALFGDGLNEPGLIAKVDRIDARLDRWDGALTLVRLAATFVGFGGLVVLIRALGG